MTELRRASDTFSSDLAAVEGEGCGPMKGPQGRRPTVQGSLVSSAKTWKSQAEPGLGGQESL